jgi:hypothetical protein
LSSRIGDDLRDEKGSAGEDESGECEQHLISP